MRLASGAPAGVPGAPAILSVEEADAATHSVRLSFSKPDTATAFKALMLLAGQMDPTPVALTATGAGPMAATLEASTSLPAGTYTVQACRRGWDGRGLHCGLATATRGSLP